MELLLTKSVVTAEIYEISLVTAVEFDPTDGIRVLEFVGATVILSLGVGVSETVLTFSKLLFLV